MSHPTNEFDDSPRDQNHEEPAGESPEDADARVVEETPDGGLAAGSRKRERTSRDEPVAADDANIEDEVDDAEDADAEVDESAEAGQNDEPAPELSWYVLKVQSSREDRIAEALQRRVKIEGLERFFGETAEGKPRIVVPKEKITEIRNNKKRIVERKTFPGYIMVQMELNEKTWFVIRETPGVGDFVGAHGTPSPMPESDVDRMLSQEEEKETAEAPKVRIDVERGDRVKIKDGPFENFEGTVEEVIEGRGLVKVMLIIFNRPTPVDLEYWQLERL